MKDRLIIGHRIIKLEEVNSTNKYVSGLITSGLNLMEGLVVTTNHQYEGKGQRGSSWESAVGENLTFSIYLNPHILAQDQFVLSQVISLSITDYLRSLKIDNVKIKWPNDIYIGNSKVAGILIENGLKSNKIGHSIVGIGLNVNQIKFSDNLPNPMSLKLICAHHFSLEEELKTILSFIEKRYIGLQSNNTYKEIVSEYTQSLYRYMEMSEYKIKDEIIKGEILGVDNWGKLMLRVNQKIQCYNLKEVEYV